MAEQQLVDRFIMFVSSTAVTKLKA